MLRGVYLFFLPKTSKAPPGGNHTGTFAARGLSRRRGPVFYLSVQRVLSFSSQALCLRKANNVLGKKVHQKAKRKKCSATMQMSMKNIKEEDLKKSKNHSLLESRSCVCFEEISRAIEKTQKHQTKPPKKSSKTQRSPVAMLHPGRSR